MEFPQLKEFQKIIINRNSKNKNSNHNSIVMKYNNKNNPLLTRLQKNTKVPFPILNQNITNRNKINKNKFIKLNNKELLIKAISYDTSEDNVPNLKVKSRKLSKDSFYIHHILSDKSIHANKLANQNYTTNLNNTDRNQIIYNKEYTNKKKEILLNDNLINNNNENRVKKNSLILFTSKKDAAKKNKISNLKKSIKVNKNINTSKNIKSNHHKYLSLVASNDKSIFDLNVKKYKNEKFTKLASKFNSKKFNIISGPLSSRAKMNLNNNVVKKIDNYTNRTSGENKPKNKSKIKNSNIKKKIEIFKNSKAKSIHNIDNLTNLINYIDSSRSNYYKHNKTNSNNSSNPNNIQKFINNKKPRKIFLNDYFTRNPITISNTIKKKKFSGDMTQNTTQNNSYIKKEITYTNKINNYIDNNKFIESKKIKNFKKIEKIIFNHKLSNNNTKKVIQKDKIFMLTNKNNGNNIKHNLKNKYINKISSNFLSNTSRYKDKNIIKKDKNNIVENNEKLSPYKKLNETSTNSSFTNKLNTQVNFLNVNNLNNCSNINNTNSCNNNSNNTQNITIPNHVNTFNDSFNLFKKNLKFKFSKNQKKVFNNKSLSNGNNSIIILNNISLNNLNNIYLDYLAKINRNKNKINNSYKNIINSVSKKKIAYASKEKDNDIILKNNKNLEKNREYYNNQKRIYKNKDNYKKSIRIKVQKLEEFNLRSFNFKNSKNYFLNKLKFMNNNINDSINLNSLNNNNIQYERKNHNNTNKNQYSKYFNSRKNSDKKTNNISTIFNRYSSTLNNQQMINIVKTMRKNIEMSKEKILINSTTHTICDKISKSHILTRKNKSLNPSKTFRNISTNVKNKNNNKNIKEKNKSTHSFENQKIVKKNNLGDLNEKMIDDINIKDFSNSINQEYDETKEKEFRKKSDKSLSTNTELGCGKNKIKIIKKNKKKIFNDLYESIDKKEKKIIETKESIYITPSNKSNNLEKNLNNNNKDKNSNSKQIEEYTTDIIESLLEEEDYFLNKKKYINPYYLQNEATELTPEMRTVAVEWLILIHFKIFKFSENTLFLAIKIFDRYLSKVDLTADQSELLLYTSFMLASKYNEIEYVNMKEVLKLSQDKFNQEQIVNMETQILIKLDFEISEPTMYEFFVLFASFLNLSKKKINQGLYILNVILLDFHMLKYPNFMLAFAVMKLITKKFDENLISFIKNILKRKNLDKFLHIFNEDEIESICLNIQVLYNTFLETKYKNIQEKFAREEFNSVSKYTSI